MFNRVVVDVGFEVVLIPYGMFPKPPLPDATFAFYLSSGR